MFGIKLQTLGLARIGTLEENSANDENRAFANIKHVALSDAVRFNKGKAVVKPFSGDFVFLKCCECNQTKLDRKFRGPFKVIVVLESDRYKLQHVYGSKRKYKYPHESLRMVPEGREGLTEMAEALCDQALEDDGYVLTSSDVKDDEVVSN